MTKRRQRVLRRQHYRFTERLRRYFRAFNLKYV